MPLESKVIQVLERSLIRFADHEAKGPRLTDDAHRLWGRFQRLLELGLISGKIDPLATELACYALQLPLTQPAKVAAGGKPSRTTLRDRCEKAAEMLLTLLDKIVAPAVLARANQILNEIPLRTPDLDEARVLADAINLDDFGVTGLILQTIQMCRQGSGLLQVADGSQKRDLYGYWEARLKDSFHFEAVRKIATDRVANARKAAALLMKEVQEDASPT